MAVPNDSLHEHYRNRGQDGILGLVPLKDGSEEGATFSHDSAMTSIGGLQSSGFDPAMAHHSLSRMSRLGQQAHITQQFRREKLRVQGLHHASPPPSCRPSEGSAFSSSASQRAGLSQSSERLEMSLNPFQTALADFGHFPQSAHTHPAFNTEQVTLQCYNTSAGDDAATLPENGNNLLKASVLGALLKPAEAGACFDGQTTQVGNSSSVLPKIKNWTLEAKNVPGYNLSPPWIRGTDVFDDGQGGFYSQGISLGAGATIQSHLAGSNAANESIETYGPVSINSEDGVQPPYLLRQAYTENARHRNLGFAVADLDPSSGQNTSDGNVNQLYERIPTPSPFPTQRHGDLQCFIPSISTPSSDRCGSSYGLSQSTTNYGQSGDWVNVGTELLLLPGSEAIGRSQSSDLHGNVTALARSVSLDEMVHANPIALTHWDKLVCRVGNIGRICEAENFSKGSLRQSPGSLSLFSSSDQRRQSSLPGLETNFSNSGSLGLLRNSKYLRAAQQVLDDFCNVGRSDSLNLRSQTDQKSQSWMKAGGARMDGEERHDQTIHLKSFDKKTSVSVLLPTRPEPGATQLSAEERNHVQMKKARLIGMVEELDRRYRQYRDQMQLVITSFESGTGLGAATPYTTLARHAMSKRFRSLRDTVSEQIQKACKCLGEEVSNVPILNRGETPRLRVLDQRLRYQRALQQIGMLQQQAWRPQRGLPERSVSVLRAWLFEHFLHPYPKDSEKLMLARLTGLSRSQVSNWFINARVRLWKPMVEEMYLEESKEIDDEDTSGAASDSTSRQNGKEEAAEGYRAIANGRQKNERASSSFTQNLQGTSDQHNYTSDAGGTSDSVYDVSEAVGYGGGGLQGKSGYATASTQLQQCSSSLTKETGSNWNNRVLMGDLDEEGGVVVNKNGGATTLSLALPSEQQPSAFHHVFPSHHPPPLPF